MDISVPYHARIGPNEQFEVLFKNAKLQFKPHNIILCPFGRSFSKITSS